VSLPQPGGRRASTGHRPSRGYVTLPDRTRRRIARWDFDADHWETSLGRAGLWFASAQEFHAAWHGRWLTTLLIAAREL
jgi:hypothetical protein